MPYLFDKSSFDRIRSERVLQHVENPASCVAEMLRVLVPGGMALLVDVNHEQADIATDCPQIYRTAHARIAGRVRTPRAGLHLAEWMSAAGFTDLRIFAVAFLVPWLRGMVLLDDGAERAIAASELAREDFESFVVEQDTRYESGASTATIMGYRCLGTKPSLSP